MAAKKEHKIVSADDGKQVTAPAQKPHTVKPAKETGNASGYRIGAVLLWVLALVFEVLAILVISGKINLKFLPMIWQMILFLVLDFVAVVIGAQLWKKANHIDPASEKNKVKFWLWNNMGVIAAAICFFPFIILILLNKDVDKKTKAIGTAAAVILLIISGLANYEWNPVSEEQKTAAVEVLGDTQVYWAPFGKVYHTHEDCSSLNQSETLTVGTVEQAIAAGRTRLCSFCARRDAISGVETDGAGE